MFTHRFKKRTPEQIEAAKKKKEKLGKYKNPLEQKVGNQIQESGLEDNYERDLIRYIQPEKKRTYRPDFPLDNGIIIEVKGQFVREDRYKHLWIKEQHPDKDIRFIFQNSKTKCEASEKTYGEWCEEYGFLYADKVIPKEWLTKQ